MTTRALVALIGIVAVLIPTRAKGGDPQDHPPDFLQAIMTTPDSQQVRQYWPLLNEWIEQNPSRACDHLLPHALQGQLTAIALLKRIATTHHADSGVADRLIPYFVERFKVDDFQPNEGLYAFTAADFTAATKRRLRDLLRNETTSPPPENAMIAIRAVGIADMKEEIPFLKTLVRNAARESDVFREIPLSPLEWSVRLACARMGERDDLVRVIDAVRSVLRPTRRSERLLNDIGYLRQPEAIAFLQELLFSEERIVYTESDLPDTPPMNIPYATSAVIVLSTCLEGFPIAYKAPLAYTDEGVAKAREWMIENRGKWKIIR